MVSVHEFLDEEGLNMKIDNIFHSKHVFQKLIISIICISILLIISNSCLDKRKKDFTVQRNSNEATFNNKTHVKDNIYVLIILREDQSQKISPNDLDLERIFKNTSRILYNAYHKNINFIIKKKILYHNTKMPKQEKEYCSDFLKKTNLFYFTDYDFDEISSSIINTHKYFSDVDLRSLDNDLSQNNARYNAKTLIVKLRHIIKQMDKEYFRYIKEDEICYYSSLYYDFMFNATRYDLILTNIPIIDKQIYQYSNRIFRGGAIRYSAFPSFSQYNATGLVSVFPLIGNYDFLKDKSLENLSIDEIYDGITLDIASALSLSFMKLKYSKNINCFLYSGGKFSDRPADIISKINDGCKTKNKSAYYDLHSAILNYQFKKFKRSLAIIKNIEREQNFDFKDKIILDLIRIKIYAKINDHKNTKFYCNKVKQIANNSRYFDYFCNGKQVRKNIHDICYKGFAENDTDLILP